MFRTTKTFAGLGTKNTLTIFAAGDQTHNIDLGGKIIRAYEQKLTVNAQDSEVLKINRAAGTSFVQVSKITYQIVKTAVQASQKKLGFDVTIGPLVQKWHIGFSDARVPSATEIERLLPLINPQNIVLDDRHHAVFLRKKGMALDLGGIAKGYIADAIKRAWQQAGVKHGLIDLGGNILLVGHSPHEDGLWRTGVQSPTQYRQQPLGVVLCREQSIVTSGIYERYLQSAGKNYHHILDPKTGYPRQTDLLSATVFTPTSLAGEVWSSWAFFNGPQKTKELLANHPDIGVVFVNQAHQVLVSENLFSRFQLLDETYQSQLL